MGVYYNRINMKRYFTIPFFIAVSLCFSSCGSTPAEDLVVNEPALIPPLAPPDSAVDDVERPELPVLDNQTAVPVESAIPVASVVAGRPGFVFNPYNQNMVEVNGIRSGTKVRDPQDPDPSHIFVVP